MVLLDAYWFEINIIIAYDVVTLMFFLFFDAFVHFYNIDE